MRRGKYSHNFPPIFKPLKPKTMNTQLLFLWQRYYFNRDIGDLSRANYWLKRIEEFNKQ